MNLREKKLDLLGQRKTKLNEAQRALAEKGSSSEEYKAAMEEAYEDMGELQFLAEEIDEMFRKV